MNTFVPVSPAAARAALSDARRARAEALVALHENVITIPDLLADAATDAGMALRQIRLDQLLLAQKGRGNLGIRRILSEVGDTLHIRDEDLSEKRISWLLDPRSGGRRTLAFLDAIHAKETPWLGFPTAPAPEGAHA